MNRPHRFLLAALAATVLPYAAHAQVITSWDFNSSTLTPATGAGTISVIGGASTAYAAGSPGDTATTNQALNTSAYPAAGANSGTAGIQVAVSTANFGGPIQLKLDFRQSGTASRYFQLYLSNDGINFTLANGAGTAAINGPINSPNTLTSFTNAGLYTNNSGSGSQAFVQNITYTLPAGSVYSNDANFAFRWVSVFDPANNASYTGSNSTYATTGTARFDLLSVSAVPEPSTYAFLGLAGAGLFLIVRRRAVRH